MKLSYIWVTLGFLAFGLVVVLLRLSTIEEQLQQTATLQQHLSDTAKAAEDRIEATAKVVADGVSKSTLDSLRQQTESLISDSLTSYRNQLDNLQKQIVKNEERLEQLKADRSRISKGLPKSVDLDQLNDYYLKKWNKNKISRFGVIETFNTSRGPINFFESDFSFVYVPSTHQIARIKVGKEKSTQNSELIKAWLAESAAAKIRLGYWRKYKRIKPADYGQYTEALYKKGDLYFKTYVQTQRVLETDGQFSLMYTYYIEMGSEARDKQCDLEQYNQKLGS